MADELGVAVAETRDNQINVLPAYSFMDCLEQLTFDFRNIYAKDIESILKFHNGHYTEAFRSLTLVMDTIGKKNQELGSKLARNSDIISLTLKDGKRSKTFNIARMIRVRPSKECCVSEELRQEVARVKEQQKNLDETTNRRVALELLEKDYSEMGQLIECACCFGNSVFDNMAQCTEGHLVCVECLNAFITEIVYGSGQAVLGCMMPDCTAEYPQSELKRCLDPKTWTKLEERTLLNNLNMAQIENLVRCPYCDFALILPPGEKKFICHKDSCQKATCRDCGADWNGHEGLPCSMVENRDETSLRKKYEEKMTKAKVRTCLKCGIQFTKLYGCNRITCRCGAIMCYVCRTHEVSHKHFCMHSVIPGKRCTICKCCPLYTNFKQDDKRAIEEIRKEAKAKRKALGFEGDKDIGAPPVMKKAKF